jgi:Type VI secretion system/phage-baseplate injector OB domain
MDNFLEVGQVVNNQDPTGHGQIILNIPRVYGAAVTGWVPPLAPNGKIPATGSAVMVFFLAGNENSPMYVPEIPIPAPPPPGAYFEGLFWMGGM